MNFNIIYTYFIHLLIFFIILCIYLNIINHITIQNIHYISETDFNDNDTINQLCSLNKPFIFEKYLTSNLDYDFFLKDKFLNLKLHNNNKTYNISCKKALTLIKNSNIENPYLTYNNFINIKNSNIMSNFNIKSINNVLKPIFNTHSKFDIISGTKKSFSPFLTHNNNSCFFLIISGSIEIAITNYNNYNKLNNLTPNDIWSNKKKRDFVYCKIHKNKTIFLPPYSYNSIKFLTNDVIILALYYDSFSSTILNIYNKITAQINQLKN